MVSFLQVSPPKPCICLSSLPYVLHATLISFFSIVSSEQYWVSSTDHSAPHYAASSTPVTSSLLGPNILLSTLFSDTFSLRSSLNVSDQISKIVTIITSHCVVNIKTTKLFYPSNTILLWYKPGCVQQAISRLRTRKQKDETLQLQ